MKIRTKALASWVGAMVLALLAPLAQANLVVNGGFEITGNGNTSIAGWSTTGDTSYDFDTAYAGASSVRFIGADNDPHFGSISALSALALDSLATYRLKFFLKGNRDAVTATIAGVSFGAGSSPFDSIEEDTGSDSWFEYRAVIDGPTAGNLTFSFFGVTAAFLDQVSLSCVDNCDGPPIGNDVPEPGSLLLVGVALASFAAVRRRKPV